MTTEMVKSIFSQYRTLQGELGLRKTLHPHLEANETMRILQQKVMVIEAWLLMLTEEEQFVITKHLVDQLSWPLILVEYQNRWGAEQARHERTLKRFQAQALEKVAAGIENWGLASEIHALFFR